MARNPNFVRIETQWPAELLRRIRIAAASEDITAAEWLRRTALRALKQQQQQQQQDGSNAG